MAKKGKIPPQFLANMNAMKSGAKSGAAKKQIQAHASAALKHLGHIAKLAGK
jgi:hypothetical protein